MQRPLSDRRVTVYKEGSLRKLGEFRKNWKTRHFRLLHDEVQYRRRQNHQHPAGIIDLRGSAVSMEEAEGELELRIRSPAQERMFRLRGDRQELEAWHEAIRKRISALKHFAHESIRRSSSSARLKLGHRGPSPETTRPHTRSVSVNADASLSRFAIVKQGWLDKRGAKNQAWRRRYFVLRQGRLDYFKTTTMTIPMGTIILSEGSSEVREFDTSEFKQLRINSPFQSRVFFLRGPPEVIDEWSDLILKRHDDPRPVRAEDNPESSQISMVAPGFRRVSAKNSRLGDKFRKIAAGPRLCRMFCNGRGCKYCDHMRWTTNQAIDGLFSNWITDSIVATSRPTREAIETHRIIQQFKDKGITAVINLQELHEHASCGPGNLQCGYAYDPDVFSSAGITTLIFGWQDFGVPSTEIAFDMVKAAAVELESGKVAVHCHAGLGRTGMLIACILCYTLGYSGDEAISFVRVRRKGAIQTRKQVEFVKNFAAETLAKRRVFPDARDRTGVARVTPSTGIPILTQLRNQRLLLLQTEPQTLRFVPRVVYEIGKALSNVDWGAETSVDTLFTHRPDQLDEEGAGFLATYQIEANHGQWADLRACTSLDVLLVLAFEWEHAAGDAPINSAYVRHIETLIENNDLGAWRKHLDPVPRTFISVAAHVIRSALRHTLAVDPGLYLCALASTLACWLNKRRLFGAMETEREAWMYDMVTMKEKALAAGATFHAGSVLALPDTDHDVLLHPPSDMAKEPEFEYRHSIQEPLHHAHMVLGVLLLYVASQPPCYEEMDLFDRSKEERPRAASLLPQRHDVPMADFESDSSSSSGSSDDDDDDDNDEDDNESRHEGEENERADKRMQVVRETDGVAVVMRECGADQDGGEQGLVVVDKHEEC